MEQGDLGAAQGQAVAVIVAALFDRQAQAHQLLVKGVRRHHHQRAHGRHVERRAQCSAGRHPSLELAVVVLRNVEAAAGLDLRVRVFQQRGRGDAPLGNRLRVQKRFERRTRLAQGGDAIHIGRVAQRPAGAHPGQHFAAGVVQYQQRGVFHMAAGQFAQVGLQGLHCKTLQGSAQRGGDLPRARRGCARELAGYMGCDAFARGKVAPLQGAGDKQIHRIAIARRGFLQALQHAARPLHHLRRLGIGRTHQRHGYRGLAVVQAVCRFAKQRVAQRVDADQLATKGHQVQVGLQNLVLAPAALQYRGRHGLPQLLRHTASARAALEVLIEQSGQLHGEGGGAARTGVPQVAPGRR